MERGRSCAMHADEGRNRIEEIEENGLKGWKLGWRWKGDATEAKRRRDAEAIIDSCKEKQPQLLRCRDRLGMRTRIEREEWRFESEGEKEDPKSKDRGAVRVQNASIRYLI
ncbi:hypothetical protein WR25_24976 [Diploscapter pachys]|uniref:Uncharacterized protein n=1 Tax=Diploscapter pachys TaxID=2018661 RepID=A0A2A2LA63_9BILA|nr:hypothetical protein WR25_24976 [Diploscapter pachys]